MAHCKGGDVKWPTAGARNISEWVKLEGGNMRYRSLDEDKTVLTAEEVKDKGVGDIYCSVHIVLVAADIAMVTGHVVGGKYEETGWMLLRSGTYLKGPGRETSPLWG